MSDIRGTGRAAGVAGDAMENITSRITWTDPGDPRVDGWRVDDRDEEGARDELSKLSDNELRCVAHAARSLRIMAIQEAMQRQDRLIVLEEFGPEVG